MRPSVSTADRHHDRVAGVGDLGAAHQTLGGVHGDGAHHRLAEVLGHLEHQVVLLARDVRVGDRERVQDLRQLAGRKLHVHDRTDDLGHLALEGSRSTRKRRLGHDRLRLLGYWATAPFFQSACRGASTTTPKPCQWRPRRSSRVRDRVAFGMRRAPGAATCRNRAGCRSTPRPSRDLRRSRRGSLIAAAAALAACSAEVADAPPSKTNDSGKRAAAWAAGARAAAWAPRGAAAPPAPRERTERAGERRLGGHARARTERAAPAAPLRMAPRALDPAAPRAS